MLKYNIQIALKNLLSHKGLTALMVLTIAVGLALLMTMLTISHQTAKIPLEHKGDQLLLVQLDNRELEADPITDVQRMINLTYQDALNLLNSDVPAEQQTMLWKTSFVLSSEEQGIQPIYANAVAGMHNFFNMFDAPFAYGGPWSTLANENAEPVIVISKSTNDRLFGGINSVGRVLRINAIDVTVIGVLDDWSIGNVFYDRTFFTHQFDDVFMPYSLAIKHELPRQVETSCWSGYQQVDMTSFLNSECAWVLFWAQVANPAQAADYQGYVDQYVVSQKQYGRFPRELYNVVTSVRELMTQRQGGDKRQEFLKVLAYLFFLVCLVNTVSILLAKFLGNGREIALRRALGAKKKAILQQHFSEVLMIGVMGGLVGLILSILGLRVMMYIRWFQTDFLSDLELLKLVYQLDWQMMLLAMCVAIVSTLIVSLYPVWRVSSIPPVSQLKSL